MENVEEVMLEAPVIKGVMRGWVGREDDRCLYFRVDMPGLGEEHIKVAMERITNNLVIEGEIRDDKVGFEAKEDDQEAVVRKYRAIIEIPPNFFKTDEIKSEIKNGVLKVVVPKADGVAEGERLIKFNIPNLEENPFLQRVRRNWDAEVDDRGCLLVRIDVPGLGRKDMSVRREAGIDDETGDVYDRVVVEGVGKKESEYARSTITTSSPP